LAIFNTILWKNWWWLTFFGHPVCFSSIYLPSHFVFSALLYQPGSCRSWFQAPAKQHRAPMSATSGACPVARMTVVS